MGSGMRAMSTASAAAVILVIALAAVGTVYVTSTQSTSDQVSSQNQQITALRSQLQGLSSMVANGHGATNTTLPVMDQTPTVRTIRETWYLSPSAHQDRFDPSFVVVNQGDTIRLTLIDNDTVAHDFVVGPPYNIIVNATVPGLVNDLTGQTFTTPARNNSPGATVQGSPGNVSASYSFVAAYPGIFEFVCTYHAQVGMIGYLVVLPNVAYSSSTTATTTGPSTSGGAGVEVNIQGPTQPSNKGFYPGNLTVVVGVNNTVTWTNNDTSIHTVTANDGSFLSGYLDSGASYTHVFSTPGVYEYHCQIHPWMVGFVTVLAG